MGKKKSKKKKKAKQPTKAEVKKRQREYERELQEEAELLVELNKHAALLDKEGGWPLPPVGNNTAFFYKILLRMYRRKHLEAQELKEYLIGLKEYFEECWDEDDEHFDPSYAERPDHFVSGHWCSNLIEEIGEMTEEGTVYVARPIEVGA